MTTKKSTIKYIASECFVRCEHGINVSIAKSIRKDYLNVFITESFIEKTVSSWDSVKKFKRSHQRCSIKKLFIEFRSVLCSGVATYNFIKRGSSTGIFL